MASVIGVFMPQLYTCSQRIGKQNSLKLYREQFASGWKRVHDAPPALRRILLRGKVTQVPRADFKKREILLGRLWYGLDTLKAVGE